MQLTLIPAILMPAISMRARRMANCLSVLATLVTGAAVAALPAPTPAQQQAAAAKKQQATEQAEREKQELAASMEQIAARWRARASASGWEMHPPMAVAPVAGITASASQTGPAGQPAGKLGPAAPTAPTATTAPVRSEKSGTAPPSADVKDPAKKGK